MSVVQIQGDLAVVRFDRYDLDDYGLFIRTKRLPESQVAYDWEADAYTVTTPARFAPLLGVQPPGLNGRGRRLARHLFDYQRWAVKLALDAKRFALWLDTGLGKTACYLEWARQVQARTGGRVLILAPLAVIPQVIVEAARFYRGSLPIDRIDTREALAAWCRSPAPGLGICNYEKFIPDVLPELRHLAGLVADESSVLKTGGGVIKWNLIKSARGIEYKLSCTATPAPNDAMEYASQAAFLEKLRTESDILWTFFSRDKRGEWHVKPHAREAFYRFMASWSVYLRDPTAFGFGDILASLPPPVYLEERLAMTDAQRVAMQELAVRHGSGLWADERLGVTARAKFAQLARGFLYQGSGKGREIIHVPSIKASRVAEIVADEVAAGRPTLVWTTFDEEGEIVARAASDLGDRIATLTGKQADAHRQDLLDRFRAGEIAALISKPQLVGYGLNLQFVKSMVFSGVDDSMERRYQAIRRAYRFGQTEPVRVFTPYVPELEGVMFENVAQKERRFLEEVAAQERQYRVALADKLEGGMV